MDKPDGKINLTYISGDQSKKSQDPWDQPMKKKKVMADDEVSTGSDALEMKQNQIKS